MDVSPAISAIGVCKSFPPASDAVLDLSIEVARGEFLAIVGGSGSGKTTTLRMINRLVEPDRGELHVLGEPAGAPAHILRRRIGYVFQGVGLFPHLTVAENVAVTPRLLGWTASDVQARVVELLDLVGLPANGFAARQPHTLSGGQRQRVGLARALAARPPLMLMDEPFGALDPVTRVDLARAYRRLHADLGLTTVMVTHDVAEAVLMADRIAVMRAGRLLAAGSPGALAASGDRAVRDLFDMPMRQADRIKAVLARPGAAAYG